MSVVHGCTICKRESEMLITVSRREKQKFPPYGYSEPYETMVCPTCIVNAAHASAFPQVTNA